MRIENLINEINSHPKVTGRRQATSDLAKAPKSSDEVQLSQTGKALSDLNVGGIQNSRIEAVKQRVESGFYDQPKIRTAIADGLLSSGTMNPVLAEIQDVKITQKHLPDIPDVRQDRVLAVREKVEQGFYNDKSVLTQAADGMLGMLLG